MTITTVAQLAAYLNTLDQDLPIGTIIYQPNLAIVGTVAVSVETMRCGCAELVESFSGQPHWFTLGSPQALYHEQRGGKLEEIAVIRCGVMASEK